MNDDVARLLAGAGIGDFDYRNIQLEDVRARVCFPLTDAIAEMLTDGAETSIRKLSTTPRFLVTEGGARSERGPAPVEPGGERPGRQWPEPSVINDFLAALGRAHP